jgi:PKD repeat protein
LIGNNVPNTPTLSSISSSNNTVTAIIKRNNTQHLTYLLYYSPTSSVKYYSNSIIIPDADTARIEDLIPPGRVYYFAVSAVDSLGRESALSSTKTLNYVSSTVNNAPYFSNQNFKTTAKVATAYSYQLVATDADNQPLTYSIVPAVTGLSVSNTGLMTWTPTANELGIHRINVWVTDPQGAKDSVSFDIYVRDSSAYSPDISFDKNTFYTANDGGIVTILDEEFVSNYNFLDSINVKLYSKSDMNGITLWAKETSNKSREFVFDFKTGVNTLSSLRQIKVASNDTIWVQYIRNGLTTRQIAYTSLFSAFFKDTVHTDTAFFNNQSKGYNLIYSWNFGDGNTDSTRNPLHKYAAMGMYFVTLTVTDAEGRIQTYTQTVIINSLGSLPVEWLIFNGENAEEGNILRWKTAKEVNNEQFVVERSTDGASFTDIGRVVAEKNVQDQHNYQFMDIHPVFGKQYYRIRQIDIDGQFSHSNTIELVRAENDITLSLYPNPAEKEVTMVVNTLKEIIADWQLYTSTGNEVKKGQTSFSPSQSVVTLPLSDLPNGAYYIRIAIDGKRYHRSFVKQ